jgi:hypothetical protein
MFTVRYTSEEDLWHVDGPEPMPQQVDSSPKEGKATGLCKGSGSFCLFCTHLLCLSLDTHLHFRISSMLHWWRFECMQDTPCRRERISYKTQIKWDNSHG